MLMRFLYMKVQPNSPMSSNLLSAKALLGIKFDDVAEFRVQKRLDVTAYTLTVFCNLNASI